MADNSWKIEIKAPFAGFAPAYYSNTYPSYGMKNHAGGMVDIDCTDPTKLTQGAGVANLTAGTEVGSVSTLIKHILDIPTSSDVTFGIGGNKLYKISSTAVTADANFPHTIDKDGVTSELGESVVSLGDYLYYFYNHSGTAGDIGRLTISTNTFDDDWGCYKQGTEVFTVNGWKNIEDVSVGEQVYSLNPTTQRVEITTNLQTINKPFNGEMITFKNEGVDLMVTPDHKMYAGVRKMTKGKTDTNWEIVRADSLLNKTKIKLKKNAIWEGKKKEYWTIPEYDNGSVQTIRRDSLGRIIGTTGRRYYRSERKFPIRPFLRLLGFYISEGSSTEKCINIAQRTYSKGFQPIKDTLDELGLSYGYYGQSFDIHDKQLTQYIRSIIPNGFYNKKIPREIMELHPVLLLELFEALMLGDGSGEWAYYTSSPYLRDDFVELVNRLGWSAHYKTECLKGERASHGIATADAYRITINKLKNETSFNHHNNFGGKILKENYTGNIVCLALEKNHIMLVRYNGKSVWCGNSTVPTGASALASAVHPCVLGNDGIIYFGNGRYVGYYDQLTNTIDTDALVLPVGTVVTDIKYYNSRVVISANFPNTGGNNKSFGVVYFWNGVSAQWDDVPNPRIQGEIGAIYEDNGVVFVWYNDLSHSAGYKLGYISGNSIKELRAYSGGLPNFGQVNKYKGQIAWMSGNKLYLFGNIDQDIFATLSTIATAIRATAGAFSCPFLVPLIASYSGTNFNLQKLSGYSVSSTWNSLMFDVAQSKIDKVRVYYETLASGARCDFTLRYNRGASTFSLGDIRYANDSANTYKKFEPKVDVDDFRLELSWANGSATNPLSIRKIEVEGHYLQKL